MSDGESVSASASEAEVGSGASDVEECAFNCVYGDTEKISGPYVAVLMEEVGLKVTLKKHEEICGCDLKDPDATHFRITIGKDDTDSGIEDVDDVDQELDDNDSGFEDGDEEE